MQLRCIFGNTEDVVEDDPGDDWQPPPIFISYQWAHQQEVKLLKKHLEMAGYKRSVHVSQRTAIFFVN